MIKKGNVDISGNEFRIYEFDNKKYFLAVEVAEMIGYSKNNISKMVSKIDEEEKISKLDPVQSFKSNKARRQYKWFITRKGFISVIKNSRKITSDEKEKILKDLGIEKDNIVLTYNRREIEFMETLLKILEPFDYECIKQFQIGKYRIDLYIKDLNIAIEFDEKSHSYYKYENEKGRQKNIEKELGCKFIRVSEKDSDLWNCGYILKNILEGLK